MTSNQEIRVRKMRSDAKIKVSPSEVAALYGSGMTLDKLAELLGVDKTTVHYFMRKQGIPTRRPGGAAKWGSEHAGWKGNKAKYVSFHRRLFRTLGQPKECSECGTTDPSLIYEWANLTGNYADPKDFKRMCRPCHAKYDAMRRKQSGKKRTAPCFKNGVWVPP